MDTTQTTGHLSKTLVAQWMAPAQAAQGAPVSAALRLTSSTALHDVVVSLSGKGTALVQGPARRSIAALAARSPQQVPVTLRVNAGQGTVRATVTAFDAGNTPVRAAVELDAATAAGRVVLSRSGMLDAREGALALEPAVSGQLSPARRLAALKTAGATSRISYAAAAKPPATTKVTGKVTYLASDGSEHPARLVRVELRDADGSADGVLLATTSTDDTGGYTATVSSVRADGTERSLYIKVVASSDGFIVRGVGETVPQAIVSDTVVPKNNLKIDVVANNTDDNNTAFAVADSLVTAMAYTRRINNGALFAPLVVSFPDENGSNFNSVTGVARILKLDRFDWDVLLHEYGHFVSSQLNITDSPGGDHGFGQNLAEGRTKDAGIKLAWGEGYATWFGLTVEDALQTAKLKIPAVGDDFYDDTEDATSHVSIGDKSTGPSLGEDNELAVARTLWGFRANTDLTDTEMSNAMRDAEAWTLSEAVAALVPAAGAAPLNDSQPVIADAVAYANDFSCVLGDHAVAPAITSPLPGASAAPLQSPTITWLPRGAGPSHRLDSFTVQYWSPDWDRKIFESPAQTATTYRALGPDWSTIAANTDSNGRKYRSVNITVKGTGTHTPVTGPYKSCGLDLKISR
ncbi:hypothetical protein ACLQ25_30320 [Micromonospora sp. DT44]|uniref:hypothetical protein n=1 Tax=Micromonospora sp. DT44 TaxID=3393439 RepID=UPI003CF6D935